VTVRAPQVGILMWPQDGTWAQQRDAALAAEAAGVDSIWTWDHLYAISGDPHRPILEGWTTLAAWAALTRQVELGLLVGANTFRNPGLVAKSAVTVDHVSAGRAWLGIGGAWFETEHRAHGLDFGSGFAERLDRLDEAAGAMRALLAGESVTSPEGGVYRFRDLRHAPPPLRGPGRLPMMIGGSGEKKTLRTVAKYADAWHAFGDAGKFRRKIEILAGHCADVGRDIGEITFSCGPYVVIRDDPAAALRVLNEALARYGDSEEDGETTWVGPPERIAERWRPLLELGVTSAIADLPAPYDRETIERWPEVRRLLGGA